MENRFTVKDFLLFVLLIALIISVWLAMKQYDRQWEQLRAIRTQLDDQGKDILEVQRTLASGVALNTSSSGSDGRPHAGRPRRPPTRLSACGRPRRCPGTPGRDAR